MEITCSQWKNTGYLADNVEVSILQMDSRILVVVQLPCCDKGSRHLAWRVQQQPIRNEKEAADLECCVAGAKDKDPAIYLADMVGCNQARKVVKKIID